MRRLSIIAAAVVLSACAPMSAQGIREAGNRESFSVPGNYQATFRTLADEMRRCMQSGMITATVIVHSELYTDIKRGTITPTMHGGLGAMPLIVVDVFEVTENSSRVEVSSKHEGDDSAGRLKAIFNGTPLCDKAA